MGWLVQSPWDANKACTVSLARSHVQGPHDTSPLRQAGKSPTSNSLPAETSSTHRRPRICGGGDKARCYPAPAASTPPSAASSAQVLHPHLFLHLTT